MGYTGINLGNVKSNNRSAILKLLNDQGDMSRKDISVALGLVPATVSVICSELLEEGILIEKGEAQDEPRAGRKKILLGINYERYSVLCASIEYPETVVTLTDMMGRNRITRRIRSDSSIPAETLLHKVSAASKELIKKTGLKNEDILGMGISLPGVVQRTEGMARANSLWDQPVNVRRIMRDELGFTVLVENNVKAFAEAEMIYGSGKDLENLMFVRWGPGVGAAIVIDKQIYEGRSFKAAELGHVCIEPNGKRCYCGRRGCLETRVSTQSLTDEVRRKCAEGNMPVLMEKIHGDIGRISEENIEEWIETDDEQLWKVIGKDLVFLATAVVNALTMFAPDHVILLGRLFETEVLRERFIAACARIDPRFDCDYFSLSKLSDKRSYIGPLAIAVNELLLSASGEQ